MLLISTLLVLTAISSSQIHCQAQEGEQKCLLNKNCFLPKCNCASTRPPVDLTHTYRKDEIPQLVVLTIDDDKLDIDSYRVYKKLFENLRNPNNQSIKATFFLSDSYNATSFCLVRNLYEKMHEIAISTVNYTCPHKLCNVAGPSFRPWKYETWIEQILNMRERLYTYAGIPKSEITGFRAPLLEPASDMHYRILMGNKFQYDSSLVVSSENLTDMVWPFTLDYKAELDLSNNGPIEKYQGLWELPLPIFIGYNSKPLSCLKIWESWCGIDTSVQGIYKYFRSHFLRSYYNSRTPVVLHINADWLKSFVKVEDVEFLPNIGFGDVKKRRVIHERKEYRNLDGLLKFMNNTLQQNKDVYFVTARQAIDYVKLLPVLGSKVLNLTRYIDEEILATTNSDPEEMDTTNVYDARCDLLADEGKSDAELELDDTYGVKDKQVVHQLNETVLLDLQSEVLIVNAVVIYMVLGLGLLMLIIIIYDQV